MSISFSILCVTDVLSGDKKIIIWLSTNAFQNFIRLQPSDKVPRMMSGMDFVLSEHTYSLLTKSPLSHLANIGRYTYRSERNSYLREF
jgi:hypothetical protein